MTGGARPGKVTLIHRALWPAVRGSELGARDVPRRRERVPWKRRAA